MLSGKSSAEDSEDGSLKSVDMELDIEPKRPSRPSSCSESIASSSPSDLSSPVSLSSRPDPTNHRSKLIPRTLVQSSTQRQPPFSSISVPRTVPCIVLSPNEMYNPPLYTSNSSLLSLSPDSIMTKMSKLSNSGQGTFRVLSNRRSDNDGCCANEETRRRTNTIQLHDSLKQIIEANNITGDSTKLFLNCDTSEQRNQSPVNAASKQLTFGMDRILGNDKTGRETKDDDESKPTYSDATGFLGSKVQQHQHQHPNYISHCSECFLLSRFCYKLQIPNQRQPVSASACSSNYSSWIPTQHLYDNPALLSPGGYNHQHPVLSSYGITASNYSSMSSMVSCNTGGSGRRKRSWSRAVFSNLQRKGLEKRFQIQKYITKPDRRQLAATLGLTDPQVKVWFQNRRMKWRHTTEGKARIDETTPNSNSSSNHKSGTVVRNK